MHVLVLQVLLLHSRTPTTVSYHVTTTHVKPILHVPITETRSPVPVTLDSNWLTMSVSTLTNVQNLEQMVYLSTIVLPVLKSVLTLLVHSDATQLFNSVPLGVALEPTKSAKTSRLRLGTHVHAIPILFHLSSPTLLTACYHVPTTHVKPILHVPITETRSSVPVTLDSKRLTMSVSTLTNVQNLEQMVHLSTLVLLVLSVLTLLVHSDAIQQTPVPVNKTENVSHWQAPTLSTLNVMLVETVSLNRVQMVLYHLSVLLLEVDHSEMVSGSHQSF
uniref:Cnidarian restricted protein n=1 Tax=Clytia hemisphaerica TaxID=252671 RepID=A0A7M5XN78_9CNID